MDSPSRLALLDAGLILDQRLDVAFPRLQVVAAPQSLVLGFQPLQLCFEVVETVGHKTDLARQPRPVGKRPNKSATVHSERTLQIGALTSRA